MKKILFIAIILVLSLSGYGQTPIRASRVSMDTAKISTIKTIPSCPATGLKLFYFRDTLRAIDSLCIVYNLTKGTGGSGTPGGYTGSVQFNTAGVFDFDSLFYYDKSMKWLWVPTIVADTAIMGYASAYRLDSDSAEFTYNLKLVYQNSPRSNTGFRGQIWAKGADQRPRWTDDHGWTFEMSLPGQAPADSLLFLQTNGITADWAPAPSSLIFKKEIATNGENNITVDFPLTSSAKVFYNGTLIPSTQWTGAGTTTITLSLDTHMYDVIIINN